MSRTRPAMQEKKIITTPTFHIPSALLPKAKAKEKEEEKASVRQSVPVRVIKTEMASQEFRVRVELIEIHKVSERYPHIGSKTSMSDFQTTLESDS